MAKSKYPLGKLKGGGTAAPIEACLNAPRCQARSKRTGEPCKGPAMRGKRVCYYHGGKSRGPSEEGRKRISEANTRHRRYSKEAIEARRENAEWWRENMGREPPRRHYGRMNSVRDPVTGRWIG